MRHRVATTRQLEERAFFVCVYKRSARKARILLTTPDHEQAVRTLLWFDDLEEANYRLRIRLSERPRSYFIGVIPLLASVKKPHRWAYWHYRAPRL